MGFLKEALKIICVENQWSYGVFWKIGCRNPTLLVWEECHYEPARYSSLLGISGLESTEALLKEWEGLGSSPETQLSWLGCKVEDRVCSLIKMMMNNQVHVVGEGMVGRAAFTGSHLWILKENLMGGSHPSEVMTAVNHQFSAGMQTVAVIPVLPHGVVQFASTLAIMENIGFVNNVKSLFAQLGSVPGALLSHNYLKKDPSEKIGLPISVGVPVSAEQTISKMAKCSPLAGNSCNQQILPSRASRCAHQSSHSLITQIQDNVPVNVSALQTTPRVAPSTSESPNDLFQAKDPPMVKSNLPLRGQQETASMGSEVFPSNLGGRFSPRSSQYDTCSGFSNQYMVGQSSVSFTGLKFMEQQILSGNRLQGPVNNSIPASSSTATEARASKAGVPNYLKDSIIASLLGGSELPNAGSGRQTLTSFPRSRSMQCRSADNNPQFPLQEGVGPHSNSSNTKMVSLSNHANQSNASVMLPSCSHQSRSSNDEKHAQTEFSAREHGVEDLFQALNIPPGYQDDHISRSGTVSGTIQDAHVRHSSGEDLFDILGLDFKSKLLCGTGSDFLMHGTDANLHSSVTDVSTCLTQMDAGPDFYAMNDGISESGIFCETGTDHLLDAVVSKAHSTSKQNSDDNVSCRTTVTRISSSSVISDAPTYDHVSVSDQMKVDMFGPPPPSKVAIAKSSSFKSGSSVENAGGSQINPIYKSQISLWMEDGHNMKQENSISTANSKRPDETAKTNRKRLRPGESPRPRPKDRQMIQDRVKELREIVPNGAKCSIDALLERTIKHMLFLQSVTKHADKLKQSGESKIISKEGRLLLKDNFEGGATWAYEVGSQSKIYPIVVEDLNTPRHMLVEMLCEERGFFLEIADIIRGLGLTILKGIMESRNDKVWAHFAVEANRDVSRMEIFLSLVQLLEKAGMGNSRTLKGIDSSNLMVHNNFNQASIPATGPCNSLQ
ncbi:transcription factor LHW-like isoform X2 [Telopea speciosissima]|uniref:transcription factor LHW-like isoform X2 n=1 Tax=Telopea speciosissima TaxID=54955 RepID=UPI001CC62E7C|nr:transcription factor LHW-like isoform X2 [Telopea speciosissima]